MEQRIKCRACDRMILQVTAKVNDGLCGHCARKAHRRAFDEIVAGWMKDPNTLPGTNGIPEPTDIALEIAAARLRDAQANTPRWQCAVFFDNAHEKWSRRGADSLSTKEKHILAVETFFGEVSNGGLIQYLGNESGAFANWSPEAFERIGLPEYAAICRRLMALFPGGVVPEDAEARWNLAKAIDEGVLVEIEAPFWRLHKVVDAGFTERVHAYIAEA